MRYLFVFLCFSLSQNLVLAVEIPKRNAEVFRNKPVVIMVSIDGFRYDYPEKFNAINLASIATQGRRADSLVPAFPSKTFPNHYTLVTGLYPAHHGIVDNHFYDTERKKTYSISDIISVRDGSWYKGNPIWVVAEKAGMVTASYFWVGTEAAIQDIRPTYSLEYDGKRPHEERIKQVLSWLAMPVELRPQFITLYMSLVDNAGHDLGVEGVGPAVQEIDAYIGKLRKGIADSKVPTNLIVVSDHGMASLDPKKTVEMFKVIDTSKFEITGGGPFTSIYSENKKDLQEAYKKLKTLSPFVKVYWKKESPSRFRISDSNRIGDIVLIADLPWYVLTKPAKEAAKPSGQMGSHGWDNRDRLMHGIFYAEGPSIRRGSKIPSFDNIHVYPFVMELLGLKPPEKIDGKLDVLKPIIASNPQKPVNP